MTESNDIKIAVLEHEVAGLREQHKAHKQEITRSLREIADGFAASLGEIRADIKSIYEFIHQSRGGAAMLLLCSSALGGVVVAVVSWGLGRFLK